MKFFSFSNSSPPMVFLKNLKKPWSSCCCQKTLEIPNKILQRLLTKKPTCNSLQVSQPFEIYPQMVVTQE